MSIPRTHQAWVYDKAGKPRDVLRFTKKRFVPVPEGDQLLIRVRAAALNPFGWKLISIYLFTLFVQRPAVPELEFSGEIVGGRTTTEWPLGAEVCGFSHIPPTATHGTLAQYTLCSPTTQGGLALKPKTISHFDGAAIVSGGLAALYGLQNGGLKNGASQRVFVCGTGGVGTLAVQIAKTHGAYVVATGSPASEALLKSLGVDEVIDYRSVDLIQHLTSTYSSKPFDIILDAVGIPPLFYQSVPYLKQTGTFVDIGMKAGIKGVGSMVSAFSSALYRLLCPAFLGNTARTYYLVQVPTGEITKLMKQLVGMLERGEIKTVIERVYEFNEVLDAYDRIASERVKGKLVVKID